MNVKVKLFTILSIKGKYNIHHFFLKKVYNKINSDQYK